MNTLTFVKENRLLKTARAWIPAVWLASAIWAAEPAATDAPGKDLRLTYFSPIDQTVQPYRIYVPSSYSPSKPIPVVIAMHGTGSDESALFEDKRMPPGTLKQVAEKHRVLMVCPSGRGSTEYRGIGENDIFCVLAEVAKLYLIDPDRVYLTGQSMGGTGAAYHGLRHPDLFAAVAPLAPAYSFPWLAANLQHVPSWWIQGADDNDFYHRGVKLGIDRMRQLGVAVRYDVIPGEAHPAGLQRFDGVVAWLLQQKRVSHPREYVFEVDTPLHGRAYWTSVDAIAEPGKMATVRAQADGNQRLRLELENVGSLALFPDAEIFDPAKPLVVIVNNAEVYSGKLPDDEQLRIVLNGTRWTVAAEPRSEAALAAYRTHPVAFAPRALNRPDLRGSEFLLANWITDAMRDATGADIAIYNFSNASRGLGIPQGTVDIVDLIQCSRPFDQYLVTAELTGRDLLEILDANATETKRAEWLRPEWFVNQLVQISGAHYSFDPLRPAGQRIVSSDLDPERRYIVAMEGQVVERQTIRLAGRFKKLEFRSTNTHFTLALYGYAARLKRIEARLEGRVRRVANAAVSAQERKPGEASELKAASGNTVKNSIGMALVLVPAGEFDMGTAETNAELLQRFPEAKPAVYEDERPLHHVRFNQAFYMGKYEVTVGQFRQFVRAENYRTEAERDGTGGRGYNATTNQMEGSYGPGYGAPPKATGKNASPQYTWENTGFAQGDDHPVVNVTWNDAMAFCQWLSGKEGKIYRLPTEAESEYACRAGTKTLYYHGNDPEGLAAVGNVEDGTAKAKFADWKTIPANWKSITAQDGYVFTAPVGKFASNAFGLFDMHGNVWEWCSDWHGADYYSVSPTNNPAGPGPGRSRVLRGGGWNLDPVFNRSANRNGHYPSFRSHDTGFRVVLVP